jgi:RIO kinase 1
MARKTKEEWKVFGNVFDKYTVWRLEKLASQGHYTELKSPVSIGKEANIFTAEREDNTLIIIKIYRLESCNFNKMYDYIKYDPRYLHLKKQRRKVIFGWVQREYRNLLKARDAGVRVPTPLAINDHILVLEMVGEDKPAPQLKDLYPTNPKKFMDDIIEFMRLLWQKAGIVHGDLSEYNILNHNDTPVFLDMSQSTVKECTIAMELLERDIKNMVNFAKKMDIKLDAEKIKKQITGK